MLMNRYPGAMKRNRFWQMEDERNAEEWRL